MYTTGRRNDAQLGYAVGGDATLALAQCRALNIEEIESPYVVVINAPFTVGNILVLAAVASALLTFLVSQRRPSCTLGVCVLLALFGTAQPLLAYAKQSQLYVLTALGHYFYSLTVVAVWMAWRIVVDRWPAKREAAAAVAACLLVVGVSIRAGLFQRPTLHDFAWQDRANAIRTAGKAVGPINPVPWYFVIETPR